MTSDLYVNLNCVKTFIVKVKGFKGENIKNHITKFGKD